MAYINYYLTKEAKPYNGMKTDYSINGFGKVGDVYIKK